MEKKKVLFVCTGNSVRSQMAEAYLKELDNEHFATYSAGVTPAGVHELTRKVMDEEGISLENHYSKNVRKFEQKNFDYVIPLCEVAAMSLPEFPGDYERLNWYMDDPIRVLGDQEKRLRAFRFTRNLIRRRIENFIKKEKPAE